MTLTSRSGVALIALAASALLAMPAISADLGGRGSMRDTYEAPRSSVGGCYMRSDVSYGFAVDPQIHWGNTATVSGEKVDDAWATESGFGCSLGARWRGEVMLGYRGERDITANTQTPNDVLHTTLTSYTLMTNVYYDLGTWNRLTPYLGAGIGMAYNIVDDVSFTTLANRIHGDRDLAFAWNVTAGFGYQLTERTTLDIGYRYIDLGRAGSERNDTAGIVNPRVDIDDLTAHEFKVGLRYQLGGGDCCADSLK